MIPKGTKIPAPDGYGGYQLIHDWSPGTPWNEAKLFKEYGSAPIPMTGMMMPAWLDRYFREKISPASDGE